MALYPRSFVSIVTQVGVTRVEALSRAVRGRADILHGVGCTALTTSDIGRTAASSVYCTDADGSSKYFSGARRTSTCHRHTVSSSGSRADIGGLDTRQTGTVRLNAGTATREGGICGGADVAVNICSDL